MGGVDEPIAGITCLVFFTISIILFACSFDVLEPRYYGLIYDDTYKTVPRNEIKRANRDDSGRFLIGLGRSVVSYPRGLVVMEWKNDGADAGPMECWTSNGQNVFLDLSLQIQLNKEKLPLLYYKWTTHWRNLLRVTIMRVIKENTPLYQTLEYFEKRDAITNTLQSALSAKFVNDGGFFSLWDFQLRQISLPERFEESIITKILRKQERQKAKNTQQVEVKKKEKERELSLAEADASLVRSKAEQEGLITVAEEKADGQALLVEAYASLYRAFGDQMGWFSEASMGYPALHYYIYSRLGKDHRADKTNELLGYGSGYHPNSGPVSEL